MGNFDAKVHIIASLQKNGLAYFDKLGHPSAIEHSGGRDLARLIRVWSHALETREKQLVLEKGEQMTKDKKKSKKDKLFLQAAVLYIY